MKLVYNAQARTTSNLNLRKGPGAGFVVVATLIKDVLVRAVANPKNGWCEVEVTGNIRDGKTLRTEPDDRSSIQATRDTGTPSSWKHDTWRGFVNTTYLTVIDGPQSVVFDEAENRLHAQKGILTWCLNATPR